MKQESESFDSSRDDALQSEDPPWSVRKHLCWAGVLLGMSLLSLAAHGIEGLHSLPMLMALLILAHAVAVATAKRDHADDIFRVLAPLIGIGWIVSDYLIDGFGRWSIVGYSMGAVLVVGLFVWDRRNRSTVTTTPTP